MESSSTIQILNLLNKLVDAAQYGQQIIQDAPHKMQALQDQTDQFITNYNQFKMQTQDDLYHRNSFDVNNNVDDDDDDANENKSSHEFSLNSSSVVRPLCYVSFNPPINVNFSLDSNGSMHEEILKIVNHLIELFSTNINQMKSFRDVVNTHASKLKELMRRSNRMYSLVGTNNSIRGYMATPVKETHIVSGYAYTVMRILDIVASTSAATLSPRDFQERKNVYIEQLKSSSVSQDFIDFLSKLTQTNAKSMLTRHYSLLTPNSVSRLYNIILTEWLVCNNYYTSLESGYHAVNFKIMPDFIRNNMKNLQSTIEEFVTTNYSQLAEDNTLPQTLNRRVESIIKLTQKDEENFVNSILKGRGSLHQIGCCGDGGDNDDKNVVDNELLHGGRKDESSKKPRGGGNVVAFKPKNTTTENKRENVYQQIKNKLVWLDTLISPLGTLYSATTSPSVEFSFLTTTTTTNTDWNSNITDYTDNELKIEDFYGNMGNFKSFWSHLHTLFDASCLEKFNAIIYEYAPNLVKSLFLVNQTLHLNVNTTDGNNNNSSNNENTLYSACKKFSIFPCELSFRDGGFIVQYLIILKKVKSSNHQHVLANLSTVILAYLDSFCLEPHVQLLAMYALGLFKRFVLGTNQIGGVHKEVHFTISNLLNGKSDLTLENRQLIISLAFCHFLDLIFKMTNDGLLQATTATTSSNLASNASEQYRADLKHYGTVYFPTLEDFVNNLPSLAAFSHAYELSIPASMFSHANENIILRDQSQTALVSQLFMDEITPLGFFKACPEHVYNLNRIIAESIYMSHVKRKQYSLASSSSSSLDVDETNSTNKNLKKSLKNMEKDLKKYGIDKGALFAHGDLLCEMKDDENDLELTASTTLTFTLFTLKRAHREYRFINVYLADMSQIQPHAFSNAQTLEQMFIYPLSFFLNMGQGLVLKNFFSTNLNRSPPIVGNSNSTRFNSTYDEEKSKFIIVTLKPLPESFEQLVENITTNYCERLVPACEYNTYMLSDKLPDVENYKLVRVNNDLYSVACDLDLEWMFNLLSSLNTTNVVFNVVEPSRKLLNFKFYRQDGKKHDPSDADGDDDDTNNRRLFVLNRAFASSDVEQQQQQDGSEDLLNVMLKNMNGDDILAVNNSLLSKLNAQGRERGEFSSAGADISLLKSQQKLNDWEQILTNNAQNAWKSLEYAASRLSPTQELINNMPMHQTLGALSTEMSNPEIYQLLVMNRRKAESLLENGASSIMQWLEKAKKIDVDLANVVVAKKSSSSTSNHESRVSSLSSSTIMKYHELLIKAQDDLKTTLNNYQEYCNLNVHVMNIMMLNAERVLFSLIALIHFYSNVHMYILDEMFYSKYAYTESFQSRDAKSAGMYVHVHDFLLWANNHANFENLPSCVGLVLYHLAINVPIDKPFIYMFQSVNIFKTPMIPTYPAIICLFIAHLLEQDASI